MKNLGPNDNAWGRGDRSSLSFLSCRGSRLPLRIVATFVFRISCRRG